MIEKCFRRKYQFIIFYEQPKNIIKLLIDEEGVDLMIFL